MVKGEGLQQSPIKRLTVDQVNWSLYKDSHSARESLKEGLSRFDFYVEAHQARVEQLGYEQAQWLLSLVPLSIKKTDEMQAFLKKNRPPTLFFEPQGIAALLTPDSDIVVLHEKIVNPEKNENYERWEFALNPKKYIVSIDLSNPWDRQTVTLTRGDLGEYAYSEPYLKVKFLANYKKGRVIFYPEIDITYGDSIPRKKIEKQMIKLLGLKQHVVHRKLSFTVKTEHYEQTRTDPSSGKKIAEQERDIYPVEISLDNAAEKDAKENK